MYRCFYFIYFFFSSKRCVLWISKTLKMYIFFLLTEENMVWRARSFGDGKLYEKAHNLKTPSCDKLQKLYGG